MGKCPLFRLPRLGNISDARLISHINFINFIFSQFINLSILHVQHNNFSGGTETSRAGQIFFNASGSLTAAFVDDRVRIIDPRGAHSPDHAEKSAIKSFTGTKVQGQFVYTDVAAIRKDDMRATLFYLIALSAHFISTSGDVWPSTYKNVTPERAEADVLRWLYNGEIVLRENHYAKRPIHKMVTRSSERVQVFFRRVSKKDWLDTWRSKMGLPNEEPDEQMPDQRSVSAGNETGGLSTLVPNRRVDAAQRDASVGSWRGVSPAESSGLGHSEYHGRGSGVENDPFAIEECEPDFDLFNGDASSPDGNVTLQRLNVAHELFMADGEILESDDELVESTGLRIL